MVKAVLDTNVLVSGLIISVGPSALILDLLRKGKFLSITSEVLLLEFSQTVRYPRILKKYQLSEHQIRKFLQALRFRSQVVHLLRIPKVIEEDPKDDLVLATGVEGKADYIVSGDQHLLKLKRYRKIKIVPPRKFVKILRTK